MLRKYIQEKKEKWDDYLDTCSLAYNTSQHESTKFTPFEIMFGRKAILPLDLDAGVHQGPCNEAEVLRKLKFSSVKDQSSRSLRAAPSSQLLDFHHRTRPTNIQVHTIIYTQTSLLNVPFTSSTRYDPV